MANTARGRETWQQGPTIVVVARAVDTSWFSNRPGEMPESIVCTDVRAQPVAGFLLCCDGPAASAESPALDPAASVVVNPAVSDAVDPAAAAEVLGAAATGSAAELCAGAALMLSMRVSTILTAVCKGGQQAVERAANDSELGCAVFQPSKSWKGESVTASCY